MQHTLRFSSLLAVALGFLLFLVPQAGLAAQIGISITDNAFSPQTANINVGDTVTWTNNGATSHTVLSDDGTLNSGSIAAGQTYAVTFGGSTGTFGYHDSTYGAAGSGMYGKLIVAAAVPSATPAATPTYTNPNTSNASSIAQLQTQVQTLLAQIQALEGATGQGSGTVTTTNGAGVSTYAPSCPLLGQTLKFGSSGNDVSRLQQFLAQDPSVYPGGQVTGYFGALTQAAVQKWQSKYNIVSSGTPDSTGYGVVGPRTAAAISIICAGGSINGVSASQSSSPVGGFISVTPISGTAPLTVNIAATVNTTNSCAGATYTLNFGDNTAPQLIPAPSGNCGQLQQTYPHVYQYGGTYTITLSSGTHSTTATVSVAGSAAPTTTTTGTTGTSNHQTPVGTISAPVTSGAAPFTATFYVSCVSGVAYDVTFGDGQDLGGSSVGQTSCNGVLQAITHKYTAAGSYQAQLLLFVNQPNGTVISQAWGTAQISVTSVSTNYSYSTPTLGSSGGSSKTVTLQFDLPTSCTGYDVAWGDGQPDSSQNDGGSACAQTSIVNTFSHTYSSTGIYTIVLRRGPTLGRTDDISVTIQ